jgi:hypothetical protein
MKATTIVGIVLISVAIFGIVMGGFSFTHEKKDIDRGPLQVSHEQKKNLPIPPALSWVALVGGIHPR